jgi:hypothetical protein
VFKKGSWFQVLFLLEQEQSIETLQLQLQLSSIPSFLFLPPPESIDKQSGCGFDGVGIWESGRVGSVVECADDLQREINVGHDVGHEGMERSKKVEVGMPCWDSMRAWSC